MQVKVKVKTGQALVVTANRLRDGRVVWLGADGDWSEGVRSAAVFAGERVADGLARAQADEARQVVVGPYEVEVTETSDGPVPVRMRERLRVAGPSVPVQAAE
jgi:hypothetical protein